jgi:hypothetical protein
MGHDANVSVTLPRNPFGQILDALHVRLESWEYTEQYLLNGAIDCDRTIEECSGAEEAREMISCYEKIIAAMAPQLRSSQIAS